MKLFSCILILSFFLFGCGTDKPPIPEESSISSETLKETETAKINISDMLATAEENSLKLNKKLSEDPSLTQTDMNQLSFEIYKIWDDLLNELWAVLKDTLNEETMNNLLEEQRMWIQTKEEEIKNAGNEFAGGSMATLASNQKAAELTKIRVYELSTYLEFE